MMEWKQSKPRPVLVFYGCERRVLGWIKVKSPHMDAGFRFHDTRTHTEERSGERGSQAGALGGNFPFP